MSIQYQWRGGTATENNNFTGAAREVTVNEDNNSLRVHDGSTQGGFELAKADLSNATGINTITANAFIKSGGTSSQFLKADGSIDSNTYLTAETDTLNTVTSRGNVTTNGISVGFITTNGNFSGIVTAVAGFNIGISSASSIITPGPIKVLNFIGVGNTFSVNGTTVDVSIPGQTNISYTVATRTINSSTGIGTEIPLVTTTNPGLASTTDKEKIDASASIGLAAGLSIALG